MKKVMQKALFALLCMAGLALAAVQYVQVIQDVLL
jgi:hypothetical protein